MILKNRYTWLACAAFLFSTATAFSAVETVTYGNFEVSYYGSGDGFSSAYYGNPTGAKEWTDEMKSSVERSFNYWNSVITTDATEKVKVSLFWQNLGSGMLGGAADTWFFDQSTGITLSGSEAKLRDYSSKESHHNIIGETSAFITFSSSASFYFGESTTGIKSAQFDFQSVLTHEIGHLMGFYSWSGESGWDQAWALGSSFGRYDDFLAATKLDTMLLTENASGELVNAVTQTNSQVFTQIPAYEESETYAPGKEYFLKTGENANGELELSTLKIYNPSTYSSGSSMSHVEYENKAGTDEPLMSYAIANGKIRRELNADELELMRAMGWTVAIPEPSAFGLFAGTLAVVLAAVRRRRRF